MADELQGSTNDTAPSSEQAAPIAALDESDHAAMDAALLARCDWRWRKVAFVVGSTMTDMRGRWPGVPDTHFASRVRSLVANGRLEAMGDVRRMRSSEIRLASPATTRNS